MVFFSCDGCGEVLKKNQVDSHSYRCRRCNSVSCADCQVSFFGDDYRKHTSCLTEVERYEKKGPQQKKNKKQTPQEIWMEVVQASVESAPGSIKQHLQVIADLDNVPRKPKQFKNFAANSLNLRGGRGESIVSEIWEFLKTKQEERRAESESKKQEMEQTKSLSEKPPVKVQVEEDDSSDSPGSQNSSPTGKDKPTKSSGGEATNLKSVKKAIKTVLKKSKGNSLKMKKLKKAVQAQLMLDKSHKKELKRLLKESVSEGKNFLLEGKTVTLKVSN